tara:strand:+ start:4987 stop:5331 length:345 start_codon:yes stop_codon:yes gene_type:complete
LSGLWVIISDRLIRDITCLTCILHRADVLFDLCVARVQTGDHEAVAVATQTLAQQAREFRITIWDVGAVATSFIALSQRRDNLAQSEQTLVDVNALFICDIARLALSLASCQIY